MKQFTFIPKSIAVFLAGAILFSACSSTTMIQSNPPGANVYLNGERVGTTPYAMTDTKVAGTCSVLSLYKEGYEELTVNICRNEEVDAGAVVGGIFFLFPFIWTMKYKPVHTYELYPLAEQPAEFIYDGDQSLTKAEKILEMKHLLDEGIITQAEFDKEKTRILNEDED